MAHVRHDCNSIVAHMSGVKRAVREEGAVIKAKADALFAPHNHPGRHEIDTEHQDTDVLVSLTGPAPLSVEFGRQAYVRKSDGVHVGAMAGLHIMGRAADL